MSHAPRSTRADVHLVALDDDRLIQLLAVAVDEADPTEVMAPVAGPPGWTRARREAFVEYHRRSRPSASNGRPAEVTFAVVEHQEVLGALRLAPVDADASALEVGLWLGRRHRGRGIGGAALSAAAAMARQMGTQRLTARTTGANRAAVAALRRGGFHVGASPDDRVEASMALD